MNVYERTLRAASTATPMKHAFATRFVTGNTKPSRWLSSTMRRAMVGDIEAVSKRTFHALRDRGLVRTIDERSRSAFRAFTPLGLRLRRAMLAMQTCNDCKRQWAGGVECER